MSRIGIFGGMGPLATVDFLDKLVRLTPASRDQEHLPVIVASLPHVPDRSSAILGRGFDPLPQLLNGIRFLNDSGVGVIAIPCNSSHHWYEQMSRESAVPVLHIARACVEAVARAGARRAAIFATRGALASGFYQRELQAHGLDFIVPSEQGVQIDVDDCIRDVKGGQLVAAAAAMTRACKGALAQGADAVIMGCTELPVAVREAQTGALVLVDSSLELARASVAYGLARGWNKPSWDC